MYNAKQHWHFYSYHLEKFIFCSFCFDECKTAQGLKHVSVMLGSYQCCAEESNSWPLFAFDIIPKVPKSRPPFYSSSTTCGTFLDPEVIETVPFLHSLMNFTSEFKSTLPSRRCTQWESPQNDRPTFAISSVF